jgi:hypothetical protein
LRELIPELFFLPEMLLNLSNHKYGKMQTGEVVDNVVLPKWARDPYDFIVKHK